MKKVVVFQASKKTETDLLRLLNERDYKVIFHPNLANVQQIVAQQKPMICIFDVDTHAGDVNRVLSTLKRSVSPALF